MTVLLMPLLMVSVLLQRLLKELLTQLLMVSVLPQRSMKESLTLLESELTYHLVFLSVYLL